MKYGSAIERLDYLYYGVQHYLHAAGHFLGGTTACMREIEEGGWSDPILDEFMERVGNGLMRTGTAVLRQVHRGMRRVLEVASIPDSYSLEREI